MLKSYLIISFRNIVKNKLHTLINTLGLSIGIACGLITSLFIQEELTFDSMHSQADNIYRIWMHEKYGNGEEYINSVTPAILSSQLVEDFPEVEEVTQYHAANTVVRRDNESFSENVTLVGPGFFRIFDFEIISGTLINALEGKNDIVLTSQFANKLFGSDDEEVVGNTLDLQLGENYYSFVVQAVLQDPPSNSSLKFDMLISSENNSKLFRERALTSWYNVFAETYILTKSAKSDLEAKFPNMIEKVLGERYEEGTYSLYLQPLKDIHLNTEIPAGNVPVSDPKYLYILGFISLFILLLASINYVTLSISRSVYRAKEVGMRKVSGARKEQLATQFLMEALLITACSALIALLLSYFALPVFNELADKDLKLILKPETLYTLVGIIILVSLGSGIYPALVLSSFKPVSILKGDVNVGKGKQNFRKGLVIFQFAISIFLLSTTLLMKRQLDFLQAKNLGYDSESILTIGVPAPFKGGLLKTLENSKTSADLLHQELAGIPGILKSGISYQRFGDGSWINIGFHDELENYHEFNYTVVDEGFIEAMDITVSQGRYFNRAISSDENSAVIVNQALVDYFNWEEPLSENLGEGFLSHQVIGVVEDFNYESLHGKVEPLVMSINPEIIFKGAENVSFFNPVMPTLLLKYQRNNPEAVLNQIEAAWLRVFPLIPFEYDFVSERLKAQYEQDRSLGKIVSYASYLAVLIGVLGMFGLVTLSLNARIKEVGIRKVLGASEKTIFYLLSREYLLIVIVAFILSIPFSILFVNDWLTSFEYRISLPIEVFLFSGLSILLIAFLSIGYNVIRVSRSQPVDSLKYE